jgi:hypothetical protein
MLIYKDGEKIGKSPGIFQKFTGIIRKPQLKSSGQPSDERAPRVPQSVAARNFLNQESHVQVQLDL